MLNRELVNALMFNENDYLPDYKCDDPEKEELIKKLVLYYTTDIEMRSPDAVGTDNPDFWIIDKVLSKEEIKFLLSFKARRTEKLTIEQLAARNNMTIPEAYKMAEGICCKGLLEYDRENENNEKQYFLQIWVVGSGEYLMMTPAIYEKYPEVATFFNYATSYPPSKAIHMLPPGGAGAGMHTVPVEKAIESNNQAVSVEKLSHWLKKYDKYCLDVCVCRRQQRMRGEGGSDIEDYWCIGLGDWAEFIVETEKTQGTQRTMKSWKSFCGQKKPATFTRSLMLTVKTRLSASATVRLRPVTL